MNNAAKPVQLIKWPRLCACGEKARHYLFADGQGIGRKSVCVKCHAEDMAREAVDNALTESTPQ